MAVAGNPGRGSVHVVENVPALGHDSVTVVNGVRVRNRPAAVAPAVIVPAAAAAPGPAAAVIPAARVAPAAAAIPVLPVAAAPALPNAADDPNRQSTVRGVPGDRLPLPVCSYLNTDFPGDNLVFDDGTTRGLNAGSAR